MKININNQGVVQEQNDSNFVEINVPVTFNRSSTPVQDCIIYASPSGSDSNTGLSADNAVNSITKALTLVCGGWTRYGAIYLASGSWTWPSDDPPLVIPGGNGVNSFPLQLIGTWQTTSDGTMAVASVVAAGNSSGAVITVTGKSWTPNEWKGQRIRFVSGNSSIASAKLSRLICSNTSNTITLPPFSSNPSAGDTFVIETRASSITFNNTSDRQTITNGTGNTLMLRGVQLNMKNNLYFVGISIISDGASFEPTNGGWQIWDYGAQTALLSDYDPPFKSRTSSGTLGALNVAEEAGVYLKGYSGSYNGLTNFSLIRIKRSLIENANLYSDESGFCKVQSSMFRSGSAVAAKSSRSWLRLRNNRFEAIDPGPSYLGTCVFVTTNATADIGRNFFTGSVSGDIFTIKDRAVAYVWQNTGTGNSGIPLVIGNGSFVGSAYGNTIAGAVAGNDVTLGTITNLSWAQVQTVAGVNDVTGSGAQQCRITSDYGF